MNTGQKIKVHLGTLKLITIIKGKPKTYIFSYESDFDKQYNRNKVEITELQIGPLEELITNEKKQIQLF